VGRGVWEWAVEGGVLVGELGFGFFWGGGGGGEVGVGRKRARFGIEERGGRRFC